jgi:CheY-like chemotaxis protein
MHTQKVLLADSHGESRAIYRLILEHAGYTVIEANSGDEAVGRARAESPVAIVLELMLSRLDGLAVLRTLKADPPTASIPAIVLTACGDPGSRQAAVESGCDGYLAKPCSPATVLREVAHHLGRRDRGS